MRRSGACLPAVLAQQARHVADRVDGAPQGAGDLAVAHALRVADVGLVDAPAGRVRGQDHLERVAAAAVLQVQRDQVGAAHDAHRAQVAEAVPGRAAHQDGEHAVREPGVRCPRAARGGDASAEGEVGAAVRDAGDERGQLAGVHRGVGVAEGDVLGGRGGDTGGARGAESLDRFGDDGRAVRAGDVGGAVRRAVVDDDRPVARGQRADHARERVGLVQAGQDHVDVHAAHSVRDAGSTGRGVRRARRVLGGVGGVGRLGVHALDVTRCNVAGYRIRVPRARRCACCGCRVTRSGDGREARHPPGARVAPGGCPDGQAAVRRGPVRVSGRRRGAGRSRSRACPARSRPARASRARRGCAPRTPSRAGRHRAGTRP